MIPVGDKSYAGLTAASRLSIETGHPGNDIRPCIAELVETSLVKGSFPNRNETALIIACELRRISIAFDDAMTRCELWNRFHSPPLSRNELTRAVNSAYGKDYHYGCSNTVLEAYCVGEICPFQKHVSPGRKRIKNFVFIDYGWPQYLSNRRTLIYFMALPYLEVKRRVGPGGLIFATHRQIAETCGIDRKRLGSDLRALQRAELIDYQVGKSRKWEGTASEIRRVLPIPRPTQSRIERLKTNDI